MGVVQVAGIGLLAAFAILLVREMRPSFASPLRLCATLLLLGVAMALYLPILARVQTLFSLSAPAYAEPLLRGVGIALICEITASFCRDLGENGVAAGVQTFGKLEILVLSLPLVDDVLEIAKELLNF